MQPLGRWQSALSARLKICISTVRYRLADRRHNLFSPLPVVFAASPLVLTPFSVSDSAHLFPPCWTLFWLPRHQ